MAAWGLSYRSEPSAEPPLGAKLALGGGRRSGWVTHTAIIFSSSTVLHMPRAPELRENRGSSPYPPRPHLPLQGSPVHNSHCLDLSEVTQRHSWCGMLAWWPLLGPTELPAAGLSACPPRRRWASGTVLREPPWPGRAGPGGPKVSEECFRGMTPRGALRPAPAGTPRVPSPANGPNPTQGDVRPYGRTRPPCWVAEGHTAPSSRVLP